MSEVNVFEKSQALYRDGEAALDQGDVENAIQLLKQSVRIAPHFRTLESLGLALMRKGDLPEAILYLSAAAGLGTRQSRPRLLLAEALLKASVEFKLDAAMQLAEALRLNSNYATARRLLDSILATDPTIVSRLPGAQSPDD
jgi:tetratricopeptide (TPR) repeat protein